MRDGKNSLQINGQFSASSADTPDLVSSLGTLYRIPVHPARLLCNYYDPGNLSVSRSVLFQPHTLLKIYHCLID